MKEYENSRHSALVSAYEILMELYGPEDHMLSCVEQHVPQAPPSFSLSALPDCRTRIQLPCSSSRLCVFPRGPRVGLPELVSRGRRRGHRRKENPKSYISTDPGPPWGLQLPPTKIPRDPRHDTTSRLDTLFGLQTWPEPTSGSSCFSSLPVVVVSFLVM